MPWDPGQDLLFLFTDGLSDTLRRATARQRRGTGCSTRWHRTIAPQPRAPHRRRARSTLTARRRSPALRATTGRPWSSGARERGRPCAGGRHRAKKSLGQNFLVDPNLQRKIVAALGAGPDDEVVEIGPGRGASPGTSRVGRSPRPGRARHRPRGAPGPERYARDATTSRWSTATFSRSHLADTSGDPSRAPGRGQHPVQHHDADPLPPAGTSPARPDRAHGAGGGGGADRRGGRHAGRTAPSRWASRAWPTVERAVRRVAAASFRPVPGVDSAVVRIDPFRPERTQRGGGGAAADADPGGVPVAAEAAGQDPAGPSRPGGADEVARAAAAEAGIVLTDRPERVALKRSCVWRPPCPDVPVGWPGRADALPSRGPRPIFVNFFTSSPAPGAPPEPTCPDASPESTVRRLSHYLRLLEVLGREGGRHRLQRGARRSADRPPPPRSARTSPTSGRSASAAWATTSRSSGLALREILGVDRPWRVALVGAGRIGSALFDYPDFTARGFDCVAVVDAIPRRSGDVGAMCRSRARRSGAGGPGERCRAGDPGGTRAGRAATRRARGRQRESGES